MTTRIFVQARMSSRRFPGKVLAPLAGRPLIARLLETVSGTVPSGRVTVLTSEAASDDPLASYIERLGVPIFRGALDDVFGRFRSALAHYPCDWFVRLCADSPLIDRNVLADAIGIAHREGPDLVTNVFPRTFPKGMSVEVVRTARFAAIDTAALSADEHEHVTRCYYAQPERFVIRNIESSDPSAAGTSLAVDSLEDLQRLERLVEAGTAGR
jgi:spore coat polysaccharide biosynthesis protein SpsF